MSAATPETLINPKSFCDAMIKLHALIHTAQIEWLRGDKEKVEISNQVLEYIRNQVEWLSNVDTPAKEKILFEMCRCGTPRIDLDALAKQLPDRW